MKCLFFLTFLLLSFFSKAQLLPRLKTSFSKIEIWESKNGNVFGKKVRDEEGQTNIEIFNLDKEDGIYTYCFLGGPYFGGEGGMLIKSIQKTNGIDGTIMYDATCKDAKNRIVRVLFSFKNEKLMHLTFVEENASMKFTN